MIIRRAIRDDACSCANILRGWMNENDWYDTPHDAEEDVDFLTSLIVGGWTKVAEEDDRILGFIVQEKSWIKCLYLAPEARGKKIGKQILDHDIAEHPPGLHVWCFHSIYSACEFYLKQGFREIERTNGSGNEEKLPDIRYVWRMFDEY